MSRTPWWIPPFLGRAPELEPRLLRLLGLVALALFFEQYDLSMITSALKYIARDLGMPETTLGGYLAWVRLGSLPAFLLVPFADTIGRRRVFLACVVGTSVGTFATAFTQTPAQFVTAQMLTRSFIIAGSAIAVVFVTEEFPAAHRGWGIGMLGALGACGHGLGALLFAIVDRLPYGWRALYAVGLLPILLLPVFARGIAETARFARSGRGAHPLHGTSWLLPLRQLVSAYPGRAAAIGLAGLLVSLGEAAVFQFTGYFTQTVHGWSPAQFSTMVVTGGAIGIIGHVAAGRLGDRIGRRVVGLLFYAAFPLFAWLFYRGPGGWTLPLTWILFVFCGTAGDVIVRALSTELFPTSHRGTSAGWISLVQTVGWAAGLWLVDLGMRGPGDLARMTSLLAFASLLGGFALLLVPETRQRELETISHEVDAPPD